MLTRVTITGADDAVSVEDLYDFSRRFPFAEWGILYSAKRTGTPRYPTREWRSLLAGFTDRIATAIHLCGQASLDASVRGTACVDVLPGARRIQLNGYEPAWSKGCDDDTNGSEEIILQVRNEAQIHPAARVVEGLKKASLLFDPSGGRGLEPFSWPGAPLGVSMGYAGGIKPDNVLDILKAIGPVEQDFWIDMESGVRDQHDRFDLNRVQRVLELVAPFVVRR